MYFLGLGIIFLVIVFRYYYRSQTFVRVLMYHKISENKRDILTVTVNDFENQLAYLLLKDYHVVSIDDLLKDKIPNKPVLITFDDAYSSNLELAYSVLKKYKFKATIFVPSAFVGKTSSWDVVAEPLLSVEQLQELDKEIFSLGLHSHQHKSYQSLSVDEIRNDLEHNINFFKQHHLDFVPAFAYPYGARPKNKNQQVAMHQIFKELGIKFAFRIGNRLNVWPFENPYQIQRIDVRGTDSFSVFKQKLKWGKII